MKLLKRNWIELEVCEAEKDVPELFCNYTSSAHFIYAQFTACKWN